MNTRLAFATLAILIGLGGAAQADILASGPIYASGGSPGGAVICRIFNAGVTPVTITTRQIFTNTNVSIPLIFDNCNVALGPLKYCAYQGTIGGNLAHSCRIVALGTDPDLRGIAEVQNSSSVVLFTSPMQ